MTEKPLHIVFAEKFDTQAVERMRSVGRVTILDTCDEATLTEAVRDCDALLVRTYAPVTRGVLEKAKRLRVIGRGGVGLENIDVDAARERGITVVYTPGAATEAVADLTIGLMISLLRHIIAGDAMVRAGHLAEARARAVDCDLGELTVGIVGLGRIGKAVARRCRNGFGMTVVYNDIVEPGLVDFVARPLAKEPLYRQADVVSLHVTLTDLTRGLINDETLAQFKAGAILINTARGAVVDSEALAKALSTGRLAGAGLDVFDPEPLPEGHPLLTAPNTLFTPHIGARTHGGLARMNAVVDDVIDVLQGKPPRFPAWT
ncbi:MAG: hydroxyacid dehydrogenase [Phycisphaerales bacterium]|nr:MAG: hydroxyacid dehydrogenase [Phycisphaerales bacterium]